MSFILDALKKSEAERRRQTGPTLYEMRAAPRRASLPTGIVVLLVVLTVNLIGLGYLLLRKPSPPSPAAPAPAAAAAAVTPPPPVAAPPSVQGPYRAPAQAPMPEPLVAAASPPASAPASAPASRPAASGPVATLADMYASNSGLPDLRLSLHVYDAEASRRYLLLNGMRMREGDALPDGLRVERITEDGAILAWRGRRFLMPRGE